MKEHVDQPLRIVGVSGRTFATAVMASLALHAVVAVAAVMSWSTPNLPLDDSAAITVYAEPTAAPVATARDSPLAAVAGSETEPQLETESEPQPEPTTIAAAAEPPRVEPAFEITLPPPEETPLPDFSTPQPPPAKPAQAAPRPATPRPEPRRPVATAAPPSSAPAASTAPVAGPPASVASAPAASVAPGWNALLAAWLAANRRYPDEARRRAEEGEVTVRFTVAGDGRVTEASLVKGSGFAVLDTAALRLLQGATLPAPGAEATRTVRIRFRLSD